MGSSSFYREMDEHVYASKHEGTFSLESLVILPFIIDAPPKHTKGCSEQNKETNLGVR